MDVKEAVAHAKAAIANAFVDEKAERLALEEVEFNDEAGIWLITISFVRPIDAPAGSVAAMIGMQNPKRVMKAVKLQNSDGKVLAIRNRE